MVKPRNKWDLENIWLFTGLTGGAIDLGLVKMRMCPFWAENQ